MELVRYGADLGGDVFATLDKEITSDVNDECGGAQVGTFHSFSLI